MTLKWRDIVGLLRSLRLLEQYLEGEILELTLSDGSIWAARPGATRIVRNARLHLQRARRLARKLERLA